MAEAATHMPFDDELEASDEFDVEESQARHLLRNGVLADDVIEGCHRQFHCQGLMLKPRDFRSSPPVHCANSETHNVSSSRYNGAPLSLSSSPPVMMSSTPPGCCSDLAHLHSNRRRFNTVLSGSLARQLTPEHVHPVPGSTGSVPTISCHRLRVSRDATQPSTGSLRSLRSASNDGSSIDEDEETDEFPNKRWSMASYAVSGAGGAATGNNSLLHRPRASTCPETKAFRRRALAKAMNRPPTPTPSDDALDPVIGAAAADEPSTVLPEDEYCGRPVNGQHAHHHHHRIYHHPLQRQNEVDPVLADRLSSSADAVDSCSWKLSELGLCDRPLATCSLSSTAANGNCCGSSDLLPVISEST